MILAIESAVSGGSLALLTSDGRDVAIWSGNDSKPSAEHLVTRITDLLQTAGAAKTDIGMVGVSSGPGSFTGIRIGIATALGLSDSLRVPMYRCSTLAAIAGAYGSRVDHDRTFCAAIPTGRGMLALQSYEAKSSRVTPLDDPSTLRSSDLTDFVASSQGVEFLLHSDLADISHSGCVYDIGRDLARYIGAECLYAHSQTPPIFLSKPL